MPSKGHVFAVRGNDHRLTLMERGSKGIAGDIVRALAECDRGRGRGVSRSVLLSVTLHFGPRVVYIKRVHDSRTCATRRSTEAKRAILAAVRDGDYRSACDQVEALYGEGCSVSSRILVSLMARTFPVIIFAGRLRGHGEGLVRVVRYRVATSKGQGFGPLCHCRVARGQVRKSHFVVGNARGGIYKVSRDLGGEFLRGNVPGSILREVRGKKGGMY